MTHSIFQVWWRYIVCTFLIAPGATASAQHAHAREKTIDQIHFVRSGGFAGSGTRVEGSVDLGSSGRAEVRAEKPTYFRLLGKREMNELKSIDVRNLLKLKREKAKAADQFQYEIMVKTTDGKEHSISVGEEPASDLEKLAPGFGRLADFVRRESERIWQKKFE